MSASSDQLATVTAIKVCRRCDRTLPLDVFYRDRSKTDGRSTRCKDCVRDSQARAYETGGRERRHKQRLSNSPEAERARASVRKSYRKNHAARLAYAREYGLRYWYGLTSEQFDELLAAQDGVCAICGDTDQRRLGVDHDHDTGEIRGLLCAGCNATLLGRHAGHSIDELTALAMRSEAHAREYLDRARVMRSAIAYLQSPPARVFELAPAPARHSKRGG